MISPEIPEMIGRLALAAFCGGLIGLEREMHSQAAGLRTHMIVAIGAALIMLVSIDITRGNPNSDPGRIAAQVVSGIGFLGAGAILRFGMSIKGLTTAAALWTAAGIGLACGMGYYAGAGAATFLVLLAVFVFDRVEKRFFIGRRRRRFVIRAKDAPGFIGRMEQLLSERGLDVKNMAIHKDLEEKKIELTLYADSPGGLDLDAITKLISSDEHVENIEID